MMNDKLLPYKIGAVATAAIIFGGCLAIGNRGLSDEHQSKLNEIASKVDTIESRMTRFESANRAAAIVGGNPDAKLSSDLEALRAELKALREEREALSAELKAFREASAKKDSAVESAESNEQTTK